VFDRVLTIDPDNEAVIAILDGINRRLKLKAVGLGLLAALAIGGGAYAIHQKNQPPEPEAPHIALMHTVADRVMRTSLFDDPPPPVVDAGDPAAETDAIVAIGPGPNGNGRPLLIDAPPASTNAPVGVTFVVTPQKDSFIDYGDGKGFLPVPADGKSARTIDHDIVVKVKNDCCQSAEQTVRYDQVKTGADQVSINLELKPGSILVHCDIKDTSIVVNKRPARLEERVPVFFEGVLDTKNITIEFTSTKIWKQTIRVKAGENAEVTCAPPP
jgi:hypothetical protein